MDHRHTGNDHDFLYVRQLHLPAGAVSVILRAMRAPPVRNRTRRWAETCVCLVIAGHGRYRSRGGWRPVAPGAVYLHPRDRDHQIERRDPGRWIEWSLRFDHRLEAPLAALGLIPDDLVASAPLAFPAASRLRGVIADRERSSSAVLLAMQELLAAIRAGAMPSADPIARAADDLAADLRAEEPIARVAQRAGYSPVHFRRLFAHRYGVAPATYRDRARMRRAETMLRDEGLSVTATAALLGYATPFAFSRRFRETHGVSPGRWWG